MGKAILVAIDGSKFMEKNISYACDMPKNTGSKLLESLGRLPEKNRGLHSVLEKASSRAICAV